VSAAESTVHIVDDDPAFRASMEQFLRSAGFRARAFASAREYLGHPPEPGPTCLLLDLRMPGASGLDLQAELKRQGRSAAIVFLSGHGDVRATAQAMKAGAVDFLEKPYDEAALLEAVGRALDRDRQARAGEAARDEARERLSRLTPAELEVCELLARGLRNKEIAAELVKSESTVKVQHWAALTKLGVGSVVELARLLEAAGR
jgi:FixJ family two-component response regulator